MERFGVDLVSGVYKRWRWRKLRPGRRRVDREVIADGDDGDESDEPGLLDRAVALRRATRRFGLAAGPQTFLAGNFAREEEVEVIEGRPILLVAVRISLWGALLQSLT